VPSLLNRAATSRTCRHLDGVVNGPFFANVLSQRLATPCNQVSRTTRWRAGRRAVRLPGAIIPQRAWSSPAQKLLQYVPSPTRRQHVVDRRFAQTVRDDKDVPVDGTPAGLACSPLLLVDDSRSTTLSGQQGGANVPGFDAQTIGRAQLWSSQREDVRADTANTFTSASRTTTTTSACPTAARV